MSENYLTVIEQRLREEFASVSDGTKTVDNAVAFLKDELLASYKRGRASAMKQKFGSRPKTNEPDKRPAQTS